MIHFIVLFSRQGKVRLQKWYEAKSDGGKIEIMFTFLITKIEIQVD